MRELRDQLREHLDAVAPPTDVDLLVERLVAREGKDPMTVILEPHPQRDQRSRRWRPAVAVVAAVVVLVAVGSVVFLGDGAEPSPADQPTPTTTPPVETPSTQVTTTIPVTTTTPVTTTPGVDAPPLQLVGAVVVDLDMSPSLRWTQPSMVVSEDGRVRVLYQRSDTTIGIVTCADGVCDPPADVYSPGGQLGWVIGTPRLDHGPVFWLGAGGEGAFSELIVCPDDECAHPEIIPLVGAVNAPGIPEVTFRPDGTPVLIRMDGVFPSGIIVGQCSDPGCSRLTTQTVWTSAADVWIGAVAIAADHDTIALSWAAEDYVFVGRCVVPDCASFEGEALAIADSGAPSLRFGSDDLVYAGTYVGGQGDLQVLAVHVCGGPGCDPSQYTEIARVSDNESRADFAVGADGLLRMAWTDNGDLWFARCDDPLCTTFVATEVGLPAEEVSIGVDAEGRALMAVYGADAGLRLVTCDADACVYEPPGDEDD